jgi:hypothetical protein
LHDEQQAKDHQTRRFEGGGQFGFCRADARQFPGFRGE